ncbi:MAG TPA: response regulator transcription factor [Armatimonadetes bacterium]|jgi:DNA-binding response OmpR family regulator|nr:response regulator transcription factor [Armatimonadota bacterium]
MASRILIVEDEKGIADGLAFNLGQEGYQTTIARTGKEALDSFAKREPDLVLLDLMLPDTDGLVVCRTMRRTSTVPILMLTARDREMDKVVGLEVGADDYITKPFGVQELLARVKAALRRARVRRQEGDEEPQAQLVAGEILLDPVTRTVEVHGRPVELRPKEFDLLRVLITHPGRVHRRQDLYAEIWSEADFVERGTLDVHIRWLREKIEEDPGHPRHILTIRGVGYKIVP